MSNNEEKFLTDTIDLLIEELNTYIKNNLGRLLLKRNTEKEDFKNRLIKSLREYSYYLIENKKKFSSNEIFNLEKTQGAIDNYRAFLIKNNFKTQDDQNSDLLLSITFGFRAELELIKSKILTNTIS